MLLNTYNNAEKSVTFVHEEALFCSYTYKMKSHSKAV